MMLEKGSVSVTTPSNQSNPSYGTINNWKTLSSHLLPGNGVIFSDRNPSDTIAAPFDRYSPFSEASPDRYGFECSDCGYDPKRIVHPIHRDRRGTSSVYIPVTGIEFVQVRASFLKQVLLKLLLPG